MDIDARLEPTAGKIRALRPLLITGSQRSGTTWVGRVLAHSSRVRYVHEPFNHLFREDGQLIACPANEHFHRVRPGGEDEVAWVDYLGHRLGLDGHLKGRSSQGPTPSLRAGLSRLLGLGAPARQVVKDPIALFSTEWLADRLGMVPLIMMRHPAAYASSIVRLDWRISVVALASDAELLATDLSSLRPDLEARVGAEQLPILEEACLVWRACALWVHALTNRRKDVLLVRNEDVSMEPETWFQRICDHFQIPLEDSIVKAIRRHTDAKNPVGAGGRVHQLERNSRANVWRWKERLEPASVERVKTLTQDAWPLFYGAGDW